MIKQWAVTWKYQVNLTSHTTEEESFLEDGDFSPVRDPASCHHVKDALLLPQWFSLTDVKSGRVHLILEWLPKASNSESLNQVGCARLMRTHAPQTSRQLLPRQIIHSFPVCAGSSVLFAAVLSKQGGSFRQLALCLHRAGQWLASKYSVFC